jgi:hypothetical protein
MGCLLMIVKCGSEVKRAADSLDSLIHPGTDGELYRREHVFNSLYVALERRVVWSEMSMIL